MSARARKLTEKQGDALLQLHRTWKVFLDFIWSTTDEVHIPKDTYDYCWFCTGERLPGKKPEFNHSRGCDFIKMQKAMQICKEAGLR